MNPAATDSSTDNGLSMGNAYDGIHEYHNAIPAWWKWLFVLTIALAPCYLIYYHSGAPNRSIYSQYEEAMGENQKKKYAELPSDLSPDAATLIQYMNDPNWKEVGKSIFKINCVSCHGAEGGGIVGPNLCDENYKHIKKVEDIVKVIKEGVAGGAMPAWETRIPNKYDIIMLSAYVAGLRGSNPANAKGPDGGPIPPWTDSQR